MCVIISCDDKFPTYETMRDAEALNSHGAGIAWLNEKGTVSYRKGVDATTIQAFIDNGVVKLPAIIHFRIASVGNVNHQLCHPFPVETGVPLTLEGETDKVLFHNGTWSDWREWLAQGVLAGKIQLGDGADWSDSRCMATLADAYGENILNLIEGRNKITVLDINGIRRFGDGWVTVDGNKCSNNYFVKSSNDSKKTFKKNDENMWFQTAWSQEDEYMGDTITIENQDEEDEVLSDMEWYSKFYDKLKKGQSTLDSDDDRSWEMV